MNGIDSKTLIELASEEGFELSGICDASTPHHFGAYSDWIDRGFHGSMDYLRKHLTLKRDPKSLLPGAESILMVGLNYNQPNPHEEGQMRVAKYALGRDYHKVVRGKLNRVGKRLSSISDDVHWRVCVDSAPLMERDFAQLAGLGWFGKNTMLINSERGSWFVLGALLMDRRFEPSKPAVGGCGTCTACIEACPTGAIVNFEDRWMVVAQRCISYLTIEHKGEIEPALQLKMGSWTFGCDVCQDVCPFNHPRESQPQRAQETVHLDFKRRREWPGLDEVESLRQGAWSTLTEGSPVRRAGFEGLKRNARINLSQIEKSNLESK